MIPIAAQSPIPPILLSRITHLFGEPRLATLPPVRPTGDQSAVFDQLLQELHGVPVVLFSAIEPTRLNGFFRLRLSQLLSERRAPLPALSVVLLAPESGRFRIPAGFADRLRTSWPFARAVFVTADPAVAPELTALLGLPVSHLNEAAPEPEVLHPTTNARQQIALQIQPMWLRCGSTSAFENQVEQLVQGGYFTIRVYRNGYTRRGTTLNSTMTRLIAENSRNTAAHIDVAAVPHGAHIHAFPTDPQRRWATHLAADASCRIDDRAVTQLAEGSEVVVTNHINSIGLALHLAPRARLLLDVHDDQAEACRQTALSCGDTAAEAAWEADHAARVQQRLLAIPDICTHVSVDELKRLGPASRQATLVLPRVHINTTVTSLSDRYDLLLLGDRHVFNIMSLQWFLDEVWRPYLLPVHPRVAIAGRVGMMIDAAAYASPDLHCLGFVDELDSFRASCRLTVVPDRGGAGVPIKMLATLAAGHPVSTTSHGLRGLDNAVADIIPAFDNAADMAADILDLLADPHLLAARCSLVRQAQQAIRQGPSYLDCLAQTVRPTRTMRAARSAQWADLVKLAVEPDATPYHFHVGSEAYALSGTPCDHQVLLDGWHDSEDWGRWTDGPDASLRIALSAPLDEPVVLGLDIVPSPVAARMSVSIDDMALATIDPLPGRNMIAVPAALLEGRTKFLLRLHVDGTVCPADRAESPDDRILGIGLRSVRLISCQPTLVKVGQAVQVSSQLALPWDLLLTGWHPLEDWGCWTSGPTASLQMTFAEPLEGRMQLELDIVPSAAGALLTVLINDHVLAAVSPISGINRWALPASWTDGQTHLLVRLAVSETLCPAAAGHSNDDRMIGVGLCSVRLVAIGPAISPIGEMVSLAHGAVSGRLLHTGWHHPEAWGCWSNGPHASLSLGFAAPLLGSFQLDLDIAQSPVATALVLEVNGWALPAVVPHAGRNTWRLPQSCTNGNTELSINLLVLETFCPAEMGDSDDDRVLGIGVQAFGLHPTLNRQCGIGAKMPIVRGSDAAGILRTGWHRLEAWGCWSDGPDASMQLEFDEKLDGDHILEVDIAPPLLDQPVTVVVNDTVLEILSVVNGVNQWDIPRVCTDGQTTLLVWLRVDHAVRPTDVKDTTDDRMLGVGVRSIGLHRATDL